MLGSLSKTHHGFKWGMQLLVCILLHSDGKSEKFSESIIRNNRCLLWLVDILSSCGSQNSSIMWLTNVTRIQNQILQVALLLLIIIKIPPHCEKAFSRQFYFVQFNWLWRLLSITNIGRNKAIRLSIVSNNMPITMYTSKRRDKRPAEQVLANISLISIG